MILSEKNLSYIFQNLFGQLSNLLANPSSHNREAFDHFLTSLRDNINSNISENDAIEMLAQHVITKPVFDALFEDYSFTENNPISVSMQKMLDILGEQNLDIEDESLDKFYDSVRQRAEGIDNAEGRQKIIVELYEKFFRTAFPKMAERLGIVYTPIEVVDFIIHSVSRVLNQEFNADISDEGVHILDPFTGTGTFMVRLLQSGLIKPDALLRKYNHELHANEIVLLAYYIAAINIETAFHFLQEQTYTPFDGIVLTDTFQISEDKNTFDNDVIFPENNKRVSRQKKTDIKVIIGNPPYSVGQNNANDNNQNLKYTHLDQSITDTYAKHSSATNKNSLYDSYVRAFRWASDRIKDTGIICFVSNGSYIDGNAADGIRKSFSNEFSSIYCFNLRGNQRTSGELSRKEGGKIFGSGSRTPIAITLLVKNPQQTTPCQLFYHDIGDYLDRKTKFDIVKKFADISAVPWQQITPNASYDWINHRDPTFDSFIALDPKDKSSDVSIFTVSTNGLQTNRDSWTYNFSIDNLSMNMSSMIDFYNQMIAEHDAALKLNANFKFDKNAAKSNDPKKIKWSRKLRKNFEQKMTEKFTLAKCVPSMYRPFSKQWLYSDKSFNEYPNQMPKFFPNSETKNLVISVTGLGVSKNFSALISEVIPDVQLQANGQCFPLYRFEKANQKLQDGMFDNDKSDEWVRHDAITDTALADFRNQYDQSIIKEDIFYYVYGILHSPEYKQRFASDLKKMLPRIPFAQDFWSFNKAGRELAELHINYETIDPFPVNENITGKTNTENYLVTKMVFSKNGKSIDKTSIIYNSHITLTGIPEQAYEYIVNGKPALEWVMERYQLTTDKNSKIVNDPNQWSTDPRYIIDLVKRVTQVSVEIVQIVKNLPALEEKHA